jgi:Tfp pilus assembly protein PilV
MRSASSRSGFTMMELTVAVFLAFVVVLALGRIILASQQSWEWGRDKAVLQQNASEALEWMARSVRAARRLQVIAGNQLRTYDENGVLVHTYRVVTVAGVPKLQEDGHDLTARECTLFTVTPDPDTTSVTLQVELAALTRNKSGAQVELARVKAMTRPAIRNRFFEY